MMRRTMAADSVWRHPPPAVYVVMRGRVVMTAARRRVVLDAGRAAYASSGARLLSKGVAEVLVFRRELVLPSGMDSIADHTARAWTINLIRELDRRDPQWELMAEGLLLQGSAWLSRLARTAHERPDWLDDVIELARRQLSLNRIASQVGLHASHIGREFRRHEGVSVGEFARRCRLELAASALTGAAGRTIADIALDAGFCDQITFTHAFRRVFGVTPAVYRRTPRPAACS